MVDHEYCEHVNYLGLPSPTFLLHGKRKPILIIFVSYFDFSIREKGTEG